MFITHSTPQNLTSNELTGEKLEKKKILQQPAGTCFSHPSLHGRNLLDGEHTWHSTAKRRSQREEWERGKGNPMRTGNAASNQSVIGDVRDSKGDDCMGQ